MLKSGDEYLSGLRDGRVIYIGGERVGDVTTHPAFKNAARAYAKLYDARRDPAWRDILTVETGGTRIPTYYLKPRSQADLERRTRCNAAIASMTYGMMGRSPDFVGGYVTGVAMNAALFDTPRHAFADNVRAYYDHACRNDIFLAHAVTPPPASRKSDYAGDRGLSQPALRVVDEDADGVVISGMKMLATSAAFADEVWIGNIQPLDEGRESEAITCVIPCNAAGLALWSRMPFAREAVSERDSPLSFHYDESDCIVVCENVKVPWSRVFVHGETTLSRQIYFETPAHTLSNHQSSVRYREKIKLIIAIARRTAALSGADKIPAVQDELGHLAALYGQMSAMIDGQIHAHETLDDGHVTYNRHYMYSAIYFATQQYDHFISKLRELLGGGVLQMPADTTVFDNPATRDTFRALWQTSGASADERFALMKLGWDIVGSAFAGRHAQYERFYMGPAFIVRAHNNRECPWAEFDDMLDDLLGGQDEGKLPAAAE